MSCISNCIARRSNTVNPQSEDQFPALILPPESLICLVKCLTPIDKTAFSLADIKAKQACQAAQDDSEVAQVDFNITTKSTEIILEFPSCPGTLSVFYLENKDASEQMTGVINDDIFISQWIESDELNQRKSVKPEQTVQARQLYSSNPLTSITPVFNFLSEIYKIKMRKIKLDITLSKENINIVYDILSTYNPIESFSLTSRTLNHYVSKILNIQGATESLRLRFVPYETFVYSIESLKVAGLLECHLSYWVTFDQACQMNCGILSLLRSKFILRDFKRLAEKFKNGWTPIWRTAFFGCLEDILLFGSSAEPVIDIERYDDKIVFEKSDIQLFQFNCNVELGSNQMTVSGFHIKRDDGRIATLLTSGNGLVMFLIQDRGEFRFVDESELPPVQPLPPKDQSS